MTVKLRSCLHSVCERLVEFHCLFSLDIKKSYHVCVTIWRTKLKTTKNTKEHVHGNGLLWNRIKQIFQHNKMSCLLYVYIKYNLEVEEEFSCVFPFKKWWYQAQPYRTDNNLIHSYIANSSLLSLIIKGHFISDFVTLQTQNEPLQDCFRTVSGLKSGVPPRLHTPISPIHSNRVPRQSNHLYGSWYW